MSFRDVQNPGLGGLEELTLSEELWVQTAVIDGVIELLETTAPTNEASLGKIYVKSSDGELYFLDSDGNETSLSSGSGGITGSGTTNELAYFDSSSTIASLAVATYPSLTEISYVKGVTSNIQTQLDALSSAVVLKGLWDASAGTFPGGGVAQAGWSYIVSVGGTVDSVVFNANDRIVAITDNASENTYASNWFKLDYTDQVLSVAGRTGNVVITTADLADFDTEVSNNTDVAANTSARHNAVTLSGSYDYLTLSGQQITLGQIDLTTDVTGDLPFANIAQVATNRIMGRATADTGDIEALTATSARSVLGLATSDSPQFTAVNIGHATDTTISRVSAGVIAVEGVTVPTVSSTNTLTNKTLTTPTINGATLNGDLAIDGTPNTDDTWNGRSTNTFNAGATIAQFEAVYLSSSSTWLLADADAVSTAGSVMIALAGEAGTNTNPLRIILPGTFVRNDAWAWTPGATLYLGTTPGEITATAPSATDDVVRVVGRAVTADVIWWNPSEDWATIV